MRPSILLLLRVLLALPFAVWSPSAAERKPNIIFILADDLGCGDLGAYGQEKIRTPNIDRLAAEGMKLTQHYSGNAVCAPSRCVLLTGRHPGRAAVRDNREIRPEGQFPLPRGTITLPRLLQASGYVTGAFGKWGLGAPGSTGEPLSQGLDRFFGYNCQRVAHNYYPTSLWDNATVLPLNNPDFRAHQKLAPGTDPADPASYAQFQGRDYAPDLIGREALRFIEQNRERPFFLYFPTTVPHLALQVPEDSLAEYRGRFPETPYKGDRSYLPHPAPRAAYAAMVTRMDRDIGRLMQSIQRLGLDEQTIVVFSSDNGPLYNGHGGTDAEFFNSARDLRGSKGSLYEGGVRVPAIVRWPGRIQPGTVSDRITGFEDWLPTLLELCGQQIDPRLNIDGISFAPTLLGARQEPRPFLYREFPGYGGQQSVRAGDWKAVRQNLQRTNQPIRTELYNLAADRKETTDLAAREPAILARLEKLMRDEHSPSQEFAIRALDHAPPRRAAGLQFIETSFENASPLWYETAADGTINIHLVYDHEHSSPNRAAGHFHFQVHAAPGTKLTLELKNLDNVWNGTPGSVARELKAAVISQNGRDWTSVPFQAIPTNRVRLHLTMPGPTLFVARVEPYRLSDLDRLLDRICEHPLVEITTIGSTVEGRDLEIIRIGEPNAEYRVFLRARAHPWEAGGNWVLEGLIHRLLSGDPAAEQFLARASVFIMPMANKDGVARGRTRFNLRGKDLNRDWNNPADPHLAPENHALERWLRAKIEANQAPHLALELHNDGNGLLHISRPPVPNLERHLDRMEVLERLLRKHTWFTEGKTGGAFRNSGTLSEGWLLRFGIDALVHEFNCNWVAGRNDYATARHWRDYGAELAVVFHDYFAEVKP